jgi:hypothetical protein
MEKECEELMMDAARKNYIDIDEYPQTYEMQKVGGLCVCVCVCVCVDLGVPKVRRRIS